MSELVMLIAGELAVDGVLSTVVVPLLTVLEEEVLLTVLEITVGSVAKALTDIASRPPKSNPMTSQPSCSTGCFI